MVSIVARSRHRLTSTDVLIGVLVVAVAVRIMTPGALGRPAVEAWATIFTAVCVQAAPYLVLGVVVSAVLAAVVSPDRLRRLFPGRPAAAVAVAAVAGAALPGCECGSVPVGAGLMRRGLPSAPALAFVLAAPAVNPVVLVATASAFPNRPVMVLARFVGSLLTALVVGWVWLRIGREPPARVLRRSIDCAAGGAARSLVAVHDLGLSVGMLVLGAAAAATVEVVVPPSWTDAVAGSPVGGFLALVLLAVLAAVCSEADAFVAASFLRFSTTAQLAFMVVGPVVDVKLIAMHVGTFGRRFAGRLAPVALAVAALAALAVGSVLS